MTTVNAAGSSSLPPRSLVQPATINPHYPWWLVIPRFVENSVPSPSPSKKVASSKPRAGSRLEAEFDLQIRAHKLPIPTKEYKFHPVRKWRFDRCWIDQKVAVEIEGGVWSNGRHTRGSGFVADAEKYNAAQLGGWLVLRITGAHLKDGSAIAWTKEALGCSE